MNQQQNMNNHIMVTMNAAIQRIGLEMRNVPVLCSQRWNLAVLAFFGFLFLYVVRVNLSVAIICMVRVPRANYSRLADNVTGMQAHSLATSTSMDELVLPQPEAEDEDACGGDLDGDASGSSFAGEFDWDKGVRSRILAMYFYGYIFTQIPGGWMAGRYGGRRVWGVCQAVSAICTLLTPIAARTNVNLVYVLRFLIGFAGGVTFPCMHAMFGRWAPLLERSKLVSFSFSGISIGTILTFSLSALLCTYGFDNGWGSIFYLAGAGKVLWVITWFLFTADTPSQHKRISAVERDYILTSIGEKPNTKEKLSTPWRAMFTSGPVWAIICAHVCNNYTNYTLLTSLPTFMKEVLKFDVKQNGALSALPYLCQSISVVASGHLADCLRGRRILSTKATRKIMQTISFLGTAVCIAAAGFMTCDQRPLAVFILCLNLCFMGLNRPGYVVNHIDLAPRYAGVLFGITNTVATIPGMIAPLVAGALTPNRTAEEWRTVFFICSGIAAFGGLVYALLADGELQSWAAPPSQELELDASSDVMKEAEHFSVDDTQEEKYL